VVTDQDTREEAAIGVLVVCPHRLEGEALRLALEQDGAMRVVGMVSDADAARFQVRQDAIDVVVLGWGWAEQARLALQEALLGERRVPPLIVISADTRVAHVQRAIEAGARGFLPADIDLDDLLHAIRSAAHDGDVILHRTLAPAFLSHMAARFEPSGSRASFDSLTRREQEVVDLLARGLSDRDLAQTLFISVRTVQTHLSHIYDKLGAHTRTEVALLAVREGWTTSPSADGTGDGSQ